MLTGCTEANQPEQLTGMTHDGAETLSFLKGGSVWLGQVPYIIGETPDAFGEIVLKSTDSAYLRITAAGGVNGKRSEGITFIFPRFKFNIGTYKTPDTPAIDWSSGIISPAKFPAIDNSVLIGYNSDSEIRNGHGMITITYLDSTKLNYTIVAGTFNFSVFNESFKDSILCSNGRFDTRYGW